MCDKRPGKLFMKYWWKATSAKQAWSQVASDFCGRRSDKD